MRLGRFSIVALLVGLAAGCATTINDMLGQKASGLAQSYPCPRIVVWIDPEGAGSRVTVLCRVLRPGPFPRAVTEDEFHQAFARRVTQLALLGEQPRTSEPVFQLERAVP